MKNASLILACALMASSSFASIVSEKGRLFVQTQTSKQPIMKVNELTAKNQIDKVKLYDNGSVNIISFSTPKEGQRLYSVDQKGYIYSIEPFSKYEVSKVHPGGKIEFKQVPNRKYTVNEKGFFLY